MNKNRAFSLALRAVALVGALAALVAQHPSAGAAALLFQATPTIPVPNLAAHWNFDETGGTTAADDSGNNNTGSHWNSPTISAAGDVSPVPTGNVRSLIFAATGGTQRVNVNDSASLRLTGPMTVAAWVKPSVYTPSYQKGVIEKWTDGASAINGYMLRMAWSANGNNVPTFTLGNGTTTVGAAGPPELANGVWTHIAGVYDGTSVMIYVNGTVVGTTSNSGAGAIVPTAANVNELHIGSDYGTNVFTGNIDEPRVYDRGLSAAEVGVLTTGLLAPTGLVATGIPGANQLTWTAPAGAPASVTYSILSGPSSGNYTNVVNGVTGTTYNDPAASTTAPTFYAVVAVSVLTSGNSNESSATALPPGPPPPPPPPPAPRTSKGEDKPCGCGTVSPSSGALAALGLLAVLMAMLPGLFRRS